MQCNRTRVWLILPGPAPRLPAPLSSPNYPFNALSPRLHSHSWRKKPRSPPGSSPHTDPPFRPALGGTGFPSPVPAHRWAGNRRDEFRPRCLHPRPASGPPPTSTEAPRVPHSDPRAQSASLAALEHTQPPAAPACRVPRRNWLQGPGRLQLQLPARPGSPARPPLQPAPGTPPPPARPLPPTPAPGRLPEPSRALPAPA
ncbi:uncharacterized protein LOC130040434 [Sorex fumeus]|uniref:uncharacterized protein LOC130040434 n=1 Tax=Sorex fumeus TaxID=62283 RepID=UPI0024AE0EB2|nr:uncharacterized protein LOC130040434 [Sorex fumeus]